MTSDILKKALESESKPDFLFEFPENVAKIQYYTNKLRSNHKIFVRHMTYA